MSDAGERETERDPGVDVLLFEIGSAIYGVDALQVVRVDGATPTSLTFPELGPLRHGSRVLVFNSNGEESTLRVDGVRGVRTLSAADLRRLPPAAALKPYALGVWIDGKQAVLLLDLEEVAKLQKSK